MTAFSFRKMLLKMPAGDARRLLCAVPTVLLLAASVAAQGAASDPPAIEYQVKASLVYNFLHFIQWPDPPADAENPSLTLCLVGPDVYGSALETLQGEVVQGKTLQVRKYIRDRPLRLVETCEVVIFSGRISPQERSLLGSASGKSVLTIGEAPAFLENGGIIHFRIIDDTVKFGVNLATAKKARLTVSSKLLRLANEVVVNEGQ